MFRMIEVVGISPESFSEAARTAVERVADSGEDVHFFQVVEQRGSVRNGKVAEFQVTLKVAVRDVARAPGG